MLLIKTKLDKSNIYGIGVFSEEFIPKGTVIWKWHRGVDQLISPTQLENLPNICREVIKKYCWMQDGLYFCPCDNSKYTNHSDNPNCITLSNHIDVAGRDINIGEELTVDYSKFDKNFGNAEHGYDW